jgi:hypothetical protein
MDNALSALPNALLQLLPRVDEQTAASELSRMTTDDHVRRTWSESGLSMLMQVQPESPAAAARLASLFVGVYAWHKEHQKKHVSPKPKKTVLPFKRASGAEEAPASATSAAIVFAILAFRADILRLSCIALTDRVGFEDLAYRRSLRDCVQLKHILSGSLERALGPWSFLGKYEWGKAVHSEATRVFASCRETWLDRRDAAYSAESSQSADLLRLVVGADVFNRYKNVKDPSLVALPLTKPEEVLRILHLCDDIRIHAGGAVLSACTVRAGTEQRGAMAEVDAELKGEGKTSVFVPLDGKNATLVCRYLCRAIGSGRVLIDMTDATVAECNKKAGPLRKFRVTDTYPYVSLLGETPTEPKEPESCSIS